MASITLEHNRWDSPFMKVVIDTDMNIEQVLRKWNEFKTLVSDYIQGVIKENEQSGI